MVTAGSINTGLDDSSNYSVYGSIPENAEHLMFNRPNVRDRERNVEKAL